MFDRRGRSGPYPALFGVALCSAWCIGPAAAQDAARPVDQDIVVTAERARADRVDVPIALSTLSGADLERVGAATLRNAAAFVPGLYVEAESPSRVFVAIRGIATDVPDAASEPRIAIFQDGVSQSRRQGALGELFDIERIEVARGPQSTLYGRGALIGAVNILGKRPDATQTAYAARAQYGSFDALQLDAMLNVPVSSAIALRVAGRLRTMGGYVRDLAGGDPYDGGAAKAVRASVRIAPGSGGTLDLIAGYERDDVDPIAYKSGTFFQADPVTGRILDDRSPFSGALLRPGSNFVLGGLGARRDVYALTAIGRFDLGDRLALVATSGFRGYRSVSTLDIDGTALEFITGGEDDRASQFSQEVQLDYRPATAVRFILGGNLFQEDVSRTTPFQLNERLVLPLLFGALDRLQPVLLPQAAYTAGTTLAALLRGAASASGATLSEAQALAIAANLQPDHREQYTNRNSTSAIDLFGNATLAATKRLTLEAGFRFVHEDRTIGFQSGVGERSILAGVLGALRLPPARSLPLLGALAVPGAAFIPQSASYPIPTFGLTAQPTTGLETHRVRDDGWSWRLTARYALAPTAGVFASYARGRRPEVASAAGPLTPGGSAVFRDLSAETVDNYEIGAKYRSDDGRLAVEATTYAYRYSNFQTQVLQNQQVVSIDAGRARAYGAELELRTRPLSGLTLIGTYAYTHARFATGLFEGNHFRLTPDHSVSGTAILRVPLALGLVEIAPSATYRSRLYFDETNGKAALFTGALIAPIDYRPSQAGYALANLHVGFAPAGRSWRIEAFANNLFDRRYLRDIGAGSLGFGLPTYVAAPPRVVGMAFSITSKDDRR